MVSRMQGDSSSHDYYSWTAPMWTPLRTNSRLGLTKFHHFKWISMLINQGVFNSGVSFTKGSTIVDVVSDLVPQVHVGPIGEEQLYTSVCPRTLAHMGAVQSNWGMRQNSITIACDEYETRKQWKVYTCCKVLIIWGKWYQYQSCLLVYMVYMQDH